MKNPLFILTCIVLFLLTIQPACAASTPDFSSDEAAMSYFNVLSKAQSEALDAYSTLYDAFLSGGADTYPENYGGAYIEDNILHINIVELEQQNLSAYQTALKEHMNAVKFVNVDYSLRTLRNAARSVRDELETLGVFVVSAGVSESDNAITIGVTEDSVPKLPSGMTLNAQTLHPSLNVPVRVTVEGIPSFLTSPTDTQDPSGTPPVYLPIVLTVCILAAAVILFPKRKT